MVETRHTIHLLLGPHSSFQNSIMLATKSYPTHCSYNRQGVRTLQWLHGGYDIYRCRQHRQENSHMVFHIENNMRWGLEWDRVHDKAYNEACSTTGITIVNIDISWQGLWPNSPSQRTAKWSTTSELSQPHRPSPRHHYVKIDFRRQPILLT